LKYNNVKFVYKAKATEEYQTSVMIITKRKTRVLLCKPTSFNLLVVFILVIATTQKRKKMINAALMKQALPNIFIQQK